MTIVIQQQKLTMETLGRTWELVIYNARRASEEPFVFPQKLIEDYRRVLGA